jgi:hypothetical protein
MGTPCFAPVCIIFEFLVNGIAGRPKAEEQIEILNKDASPPPAKAAAIKNLQQQLIQKP